MSNGIDRPAINPDKALEYMKTNYSDWAAGKSKYDIYEGAKR